MVRSQYGRPLHSVPESRDPRDGVASNRIRRNRSPGLGHNMRGRSPRASPWRHGPEGRGDDHPHGPYRRDSSRDFRSANNRKVNKRKWRRNKGKKKRKGKGRGPLLSGGNIAPVSGSNRQPIASMRMRMDDYITPRTGRMLPFGKSNDIEHAVARARREASTRTKDTFWTKKLLDAESSHPNRWAHSGFKELYREELGYSEAENKEKERSLRRTPPRGSRDEFSRRSSPKKRTPPPGDRGSRKGSNVLVKKKTEPRIRGGKPHGRKSRSLSRSRSPRGRGPPISGSKIPGSPSGPRKSYLKPNKRSYSHSLSASPSSVSSRSRSDSRSYSSYTSSRSSSSSSSFTSSSSGSLRSYRRRRSYSRSSKSWSRSPSIVRRSPTKRRKPIPPKVVAGPPKEKSKPLPKPISNVMEPPSSYYANASGGVAIGLKAKGKQAPALKQRAPPRHRHRVAPAPPAPVPAPVPPPQTNDYYDKEHTEKSAAPYVTPIEKIQFKSDVRREAPSAVYKPPPPPLDPPPPHNVTGGPIVVPVVRSEGEQSNSESSSEDDDAPMKMTLSERFGKLAQLSSQRQEYEGVRMKIVREGGQDKKVYLEGGGVSRSPSPIARRSNVAHERWLREHKAEYDEYEERYGEFRHWDPHRDLPRELPPNWDDINVRYQYYKESGYFGERSITMEDYLKWEEWWYRYRDWLEKYGGTQEESLKYRPYNNYDFSRGTSRDRWMRRESQRDKDGHKRHRY